MVNVRIGQYEDFGCIGYVVTTRTLGLFRVFSDDSSVLFIVHAIEAVQQLNKHFVLC